MQADGGGHNVWGRQMTHGKQVAANMRRGGGTDKQGKWVADKTTRVGGKGFSGSGGGSAAVAVAAAAVAATAGEGRDVPAM
jgi:hypothetical protein